MTNGSVINTTSSITARDVCTSPIQVCLNNIQNGISVTPLALPSKDTSSSEALENSRFENVSPTSHTSNSSPFARSSSSNSNSSLALSTNCGPTNVNHTVSSILNPIESSHETVGKENNSLKPFKYTKDIATNKNEQINEVIMNKT